METVIENQSVIQRLRLNIFKGSNEVHKCTLCDFKCALKGDWNKHVREVHDGKQDWKCELCDQKFTRKLSLKEHITKIHEGQKPKKRKRNLKCSVCGHTCGSRMGMNKHIKRHHDGEDVRYGIRGYEA